MCVCMWLQVIALPTGNSWLCCFEVKLLLSDKQRAEQVLKLADSSVQHVLCAFITVLTNQKKHPMCNEVKKEGSVCLHVSQLNLS